MKGKSPDIVTGGSLFKLVSIFYFLFFPFDSRSEDGESSVALEKQKR